MGREVRMVPKDWEHPKNSDGRFKSLHDSYVADAEDFMAVANEEGLQEAIDYMGVPDAVDYMPVWDKSERTHLMMYENTTEGTPISPAFETPEELARWLADNNASSFGSHTATYEQWLNTCKTGWAMSAVMVGGKLKSGVEAFSE